MSLKKKPRINSNSVPEDTPKVSPGTGLGVSTNLAGEELRLVQRITNNTRWLKFTVYISLIFCTLWAVFNGLTIVVNISNILSTPPISFEPLNLLTQSVWFLIICGVWGWLAYQGFKVVMKIGQWQNEAKINLLGDPNADARDPSRAFIIRIGAMGCLRRILNAYQRNRVYLVIIQWGLIFALIFYLVAFSGGLIIGVFLQPIIDSSLPEVIEGIILIIIFIGSIGFPGIGFLMVFLSRQELNKWFNRLEGRDYIIEDVVAATPIEVWMVWRVQPGFWEIVGEIIEFCQNAPQSLGLLVAGCKLNLTEVVGFVELLTTQGWLKELSDTPDSFRYTTTDAGRGFLQSMIGAWNRTFVRGGLPNRWSPE